MEDKTDKTTFDSWKEIATYLRRTEKTCRRWEKELGLPVHRLEDSPRARVFAYKEEIDLWIKKAGNLDALAEAEKTRAVGFMVRKRRFVYGAVALGAILVLLVAWLSIFKKEGRLPIFAPIHSIAILPFEDLSPGKDQEHLADGMTDALINALCNIPGLWVPARTSSFFFKGKKMPLQEIGRLIRADALIEGSIQVSGKTMRITVDLVKAIDGYHLWSENYDRPLDDIFAVQDEISRKIVDTLKVKILRGEKASLIRPATVNLEAYNLYLEGRYFWNKRGKENLLRSIECFEKAIAIDPKYALAYAGLANTFFILGFNLELPSDETYPSAIRFARKALEIDDKLAEAYCVLAFIKCDHEWDFAGAESEFKRAIEISPGDSFAHHYYAFLLAFLGRHEEAIKEIKLARDLDPLAPRLRANVASVLYFARKYDEALDELKKALEFDPSHCANYHYFKEVYIEMEKFEEALKYGMKGVECDKEHPNAYANLAIAYARAGKTEEARKILIKLIELSKKEYVSSVLLAVVYGCLGERDIAFDLLNKACAERDSRMIELKSGPYFDPLRSDPRFTALLKKIGLEK